MRHPPQWLGRRLVALAFVPSLLLLVAVAASPARAAAGWTMANGGGSQTLTNGTETLVTFSTAQIDAGGSVIDLANERFVLPRTGFYVVLVTWMWETTVPVQATIGVRLNGTNVSSFIRQPGGAVAQGTLTGSWPLSGTAGDFVTVYVNPGAVTGVTSRGNGAVNLRTSATLIELDAVPTFPPFPTASPGPSATAMTIDQFTGTAAAMVDTLTNVVLVGLGVVVATLTALLIAVGLKR